ncbi:phosphotransferase [Kutzneria buriramensis]|uniref:Aminoglycoside phosphotransferase (APT) family kinase protein n=1 Tax=Kutzneria buriramensis TaxID=1045776 RepID=A0A3E0HHX8_9PSEU|nr:phosphotransferase [Kutzneria buriramensis]REH44966.1 aminoglycoside phosphotransferase (APT) family kinase protein [Kutzneria buriramensis]
MIDENLVRALLRDQHPDLAELALRPGPKGWDNEMWRLGETLAVRLPHATERASELLLKEFRLLPALDLPLPIPTPIRLGEPSARFPKHWTVVEWVPGEPADRSPITRHEAADTLAAFLKVLHQKAPADAPTHTFAPPDWTGTPVWLHGDLHPANVVTENGNLAGIIDFGEFCGGDPAIDLSAAWVLLPPGSAGRFFAAYGSVDDATIARARAWATRKAQALIEVGQAGDEGRPGGKPTWGPAGRRAQEALAWA